MSYRSLQNCGTPMIRELGWLWFFLKQFEVAYFDCIVVFEGVNTIELNIFSIFIPRIESTIPIKHIPLTETLTEVISAALTQFTTSTKYRVKEKDRGKKKTRTE